MASHIGQAVGAFIGFNIFVPLNDVDWLNQHIFTQNPLKVKIRVKKEPLVNHRSFLHIQAFLTLGIVLIVHFFVAEKVVERDRNKSYFSIFKIIFKILKKHHIQILIFFIFCINFGPGLSGSPFSSLLVTNVIFFSKEISKK